MTTTFEIAKVGDRVWSLDDRKWHTIKDMYVGCSYPIRIDNGYTFTIDGKRTHDGHKTLFWDEIPIIAPTKPLPKLEVDTKVLVWNNECETEQKRHFSYFDENEMICCFADGGTSWSSEGETMQWSYWELADDC